MCESAGTVDGVMCSAAARSMFKQNSGIKL